MDVVNTAIAGSMESGDVLFEVDHSVGLSITIDSIVGALFLEDIEQSVRAVLAEFGVENAAVRLHDKGALDCVIRARARAAICSACNVRYDWKKEDAL